MIAPTPPSYCSLGFRPMNAGSLRVAATMLWAVGCTSVSSGERTDDGGASLTTGGQSSADASRGAGGSQNGVSCLADCVDYYDCSYALCERMGGAMCGAERLEGLRGCDALTESDCTASLLSRYRACDETQGAGGMAASGGASGGGTPGSGGASGSSGSSAFCEDSCQGCCNAADSCLPGTDTTNCGANGEPCAACSNGDECIDHACRPEGGVVTACDTYTSCETCAEQPDCAWCGASDTCVATNPNNPAALNGCEGDWRVYAASCSDSCVLGYGDCNGCTGDSTCGWCEGNRTCMPGVLTGPTPTIGSCDDWRPFPETCFF